MNEGVLKLKMTRDALFDSSLFTETWSFCLFFSPIVTAVKKKQLMAAALTAEQRELLCTARKNSVKKKRKNRRLLYLESFSEHCLTF